MESGEITFVGIVVRSYPGGVQRCQYTRWAVKLDAARHHDMVKSFLNVGVRDDC